MMQKIFVLLMCIVAVGISAEAQKPAARPSSTSTKKNTATQVPPKQTPTVQPTQTVVTQQAAPPVQTTVTVIDEEDPLNNVIRAANAAFNDRDFARAAALFEEVLVEDPSDQYCWAYVAAAKRRLNDRQGALDALRKALVNAPADDIEFRGQIYRDMAETQLELRDTVSAVESLSNALALNDKDIYALDLRGHLYDECGNSDGAIADFQHMIDIDADNINAYVYLAETYGVAKLPDKAFETINTAIGINPNNPDCYFTRSVLYYNKKDYESAIDDFIRCLEFDAGNSFYLSMLDPFVASARNPLTQKLTAKRQADPENKLWKQLLDSVKSKAQNKEKKDKMKQKK